MDCTQSCSSTRWIPWWKTADGGENPSLKEFEVTSAVKSTPSGPTVPATKKDPATQLKAAAEKWCKENSEPEPKCPDGCVCKVIVWETQIGCDLELTVEWVERVMDKDVTYFFEGTAFVAKQRSRAECIPKGRKKVVLAGLYLPKEGLTVSRDDERPVTVAMLTDALQSLKGSPGKAGRT